MLDTQDLRLDLDTGEVRLLAGQTRQCLFRLTRQGIAVWSKKLNREEVIPWYIFFRWLSLLAAGKGAV